MIQFIIFLTFCGVNGATTQGPDTPPTVLSDSTNISNIISSMVDKGPTKSGDDVMGLPDDLVFDALVGNVNTLQDQIELCEEELIEKVGSTRLLRHGHQANDNAGSEGGKTNSPISSEAKKSGDVEEEEEGKAKATKGGRVLKRRARGAAPDLLMAKTASRSEHHDTLVRELVNRLSSRLDYLKSSLAQCYGLFQIWNKKQS